MVGVLSQVGFESSCCCKVWLLLSNSDLRKGLFRADNLQKHLEGRLNMIELAMAGRRATLNLLIILLGGTLMASLQRWSHYQGR